MRSSMRACNMELQNIYKIKYYSKPIILTLAVDHRDVMMESVIRECQCSVLSIAHKCENTTSYFNSLATSTFIQLVKMAILRAILCDWQPAIA